MLYSCIMSSRDKPQILNHQYLEKSWASLTLYYPFTCTITEIRLPALFADMVTPGRDDPARVRDGLTSARFVSAAAKVLNPEN